VGFTGFANVTTGSPFRFHGRQPKTKTSIAISRGSPIHHPEVHAGDMVIELEGIGLRSIVSPTTGPRGWTTVVPGR
jgi:hypothetical protein